MAADDDDQRIAEAVAEVGSALVTLGRDGQRRDQATLIGRCRTIARTDDTHAMADGMAQLAKDARRVAGG
jgi:hypothetical protein